MKKSATLTPCPGIREPEKHIRTFPRFFLLCWLTLCWTVLAFVFPASSASAAVEYSVQTVPNVQLRDKNNFVSNPDGIITPQDVAAINSMAAELRNSMGIELAVVAVNSIGQNDARMFATEPFNFWGLGKKGRDNGLLIQLVTSPPQRSVVFEVGYGLEGTLPDAVSFRLQQRYMIPDLKEGNYSPAMRKGVEAVHRYLQGSDYERQAMLPGEPQAAATEDESPLDAIAIVAGPYTHLKLPTHTPV